MSKITKKVLVLTGVCVSLWSVGAVQGGGNKLNFAKSPAQETNLSQADTSQTQTAPSLFRLQGKLDEKLTGSHNLLLKVYTDQNYEELIAEKTFSQVEFADGLFDLEINPLSLGLIQGKEYGLTIEISGTDIPVLEAKLEIVPSLTIGAQKDTGDGPVTTGKYDFSGSYPAPDFVIRVTNTSDGYGLWARSTGGTALLAETGGTGIAVHAKNASGTALLSEGKAKIQGDLELTGSLIWPGFNLPANSVGTSQITDGSILDADISPTANIAASKINRTGLDADLLDGLNSTQFLTNTADIQTSGNLKVDGTGYS
ncbi:MAG: hypothetical protein HYY56_04445, partial [Candidatus Omnitrophica bacterium]|nr:hypothetical protein [Candidatus Omnitrophota bacterium]